jgi:simple sugar transport system substrate-binding protein
MHGDRAALLRRLGVALADGSGGDVRLPRHPRWKFTVLSYLTTDPLFVALQYGLQDACALVGCSPSWGGSARGEAAELAKAVDLAVAAKADGIAVPLVGSDELDESIARALEAGIPILALNARARGDLRLAYIGMRAEPAAAALVTRIAKAVRRGAVAVFAGTRELTALQPLADAVVAGLGRTGSLSASFVSTGPDVYTQLNAVAEYVSTHREVRGLLALDNGSTEGLGFALKKLRLRRRGVVAAGSGVLPATLKLIDEGELAFTIDEQPYQQGFAAVVQLFLARLSGGLVAPSDVHTGPVVVTKANLKPYLTTRTRYEGSSSKQKYPID